MLSFKDTLKGRLPVFSGHSTFALVLCPVDCNTFLGTLFAKVRYICIYVCRKYVSSHLKELTDSLLYVQ